MNWEQPEGELFTALLMVFGGPPSKVKRYADGQVRLLDGDAKIWERNIGRACKAMAREHFGDRFKQLYVENQGLHMKNKFIRWCLNEQR